MKRIMVFIIGLAFVFTASVSAQPPAPPTTNDTVPDKVQVAPVDAKDKSDAKDKKDLKKTKKTKKENAGETGLKPVVR
jgi:hypothetical protein